MRNETRLNDNLICIAAMHDEVEKLSYLLSLGCDKETLDEALEESCKKGSIKSFRLLLVAGADPLASKGECMLWACHLGRHFEMCLSSKTTHFAVLFR